MPSCASDWIHALDLVPHPEGGYYREVYRSAEIIEGNSLPARYDGARAVATSIYYLLNAYQVSRLHRLSSDEIWYYHDGCGLDIHCISPNGAYSILPLGTDLTKGQHPQVIVSHGTWFGATLIDPAGYTLVGCVVAPGFDGGDLELAEGEAMLWRYPQHAQIIRRLTD